MALRVAFFRPSELVLITFLIYTAGVGLARPIDPSIQRTAVTINLSVIAALTLLARVDSLRSRLPLGVMRDWFPLPVMLLIYREMGWFALPHPNTNLENAWIVWDRLLLNEWGFRAAVEFLGPVGPSVLEVAYALVYSMGPLCLAALYLTGNRPKVDEFLFLFLLAVLSSDALFPFFPSEPPRTVFPDQDLPSVITVFRHFNHWYLSGLGIHMSVFPSAHVSGSFSAAIGLIRLIPEKPWIGRGMLVLATLIALATIYGRYHYAVDALAGLAISLAAWGIAHLVYRQHV